ncbi:MAG: hypothetical protein J7L89_01570 [Bacteroidales bacterium]|nr:hypothetical protein [Bacteroidales bacterium]
MKKISRWLLALSLVVVGLQSCETDSLPTTPEGIEAEPVGTLRVWFKISHPWLPLDRIVRTGLHVAKDGMEIYKGYYLQSANVTDFQENYFFYLAPGNYYYEASIACICGGDSCSAGGFPGNQFGSKHTMGRFTIEKDQVTTIIPTFQ